MGQARWKEKGGKSGGCPSLVNNLQTSLFLYGCALVVISLFVLVIGL
jgi:hypothetical protein